MAYPFVSLNSSNVHFSDRNGVRMGTSPKQTFGNVGSFDVPKDISEHPFAGLSSGICVVSYSGFSFWIDIDWVGGVILGVWCDIWWVV